jgi:predicted GNAT superfamily acetyltransferase
MAVIASVWGPEAMPPALLRAFQHAGTSLLGAEDGGEFVGFVLGFLGTEEGLHLHSHMLAVAPAQQSRGIGYALKVAQRAAALDQGIEEIRWTYDPLIARNARFNLNRLGAVATAFFPNFYGDMPDKLNEGDRSDRFEVRWRLRSLTVETRLREPGQFLPAVLLPSLLDAEGPADTPVPVETGATSLNRVTVAIPGDYQALRMRDPELSMRWREASARAFRACFDAGLVTDVIADGGYWFLRAEFA